MRMFSFKGVNPVGSVGDFFEYWKQPTPYRWRILALAVALSFTLIVVAMPKTERAPPAKPDVIWINSWPKDRSEKEIIASNIANQKRKDAEAAVEQQRQALRKEFYRTLAKASGMDPDALERQYAPKPAAPVAAAPAAAPAATKPTASPAK